MMLKIPLILGIFINTMMIIFGILVGMRINSDKHSKTKNIKRSST